MEEIKKYKHIKGAIVEFDDYSGHYKYTNGHALIPAEIVENGSDWELIDERIYLALNSNAGWEYYSSCELTKDQLNIMEKALNNETQGWTDEDMVEFAEYWANDTDNDMRRESLGCWKTKKARAKRQNINL